MTGHFTTLDGCERWTSILSEFVTPIYRLPFSHIIPRDEARPFSTPREQWDYRVYKLESVEYSKGLAHYVEVYNG